MQPTLYTCPTACPSLPVPPPPPRQRLQLTGSQAFYLLINGRTMAGASMMLRDVYSSDKDDDGFLYCTYTSQEAFGWTLSSPGLDAPYIIPTVFYLLDWFAHCHFVCLHVYIPSVHVSPVFVRFVPASIVCVWTNLCLYVCVCVCVYMLTPYYTLSEFLNLCPIIIWDIEWYFVCFCSGSSKKIYDV